MKALTYIFLFVISFQLFSQSEDKVKSKVAHLYEYNDWAGGYRYSSSLEEFYRADGQKELEITFISDSIKSI